MRRVQAALFIAVLVAWNAPGHAARGQFDVVHTVELKPEACRAIDNPVVVDRGRAIYVGTEERPGRPRARLVWLADHVRYAVNLPLRSSRSSPVATIRHDLGYYDTPSGRAGWLVTREETGRRTVRFVGVDIRGRSVDQSVEVTRTNPRREPTETRPLGFAPHTGSFFVEERRHRPQARYPWQVDLLRVGGSGRVDRVGRVQTEARIHGVHFDGRGQRAVVAEYGTHPARGKRPEGHIIDLRSGSQRSVTIPPTAYGFAFSQDGSTLWAYSNQLSQLWTIDLLTGRRVAKSAAGPLGHALGRVLPGYLLLVRDHGLELIDHRSRRRAGYLSMKKVVPGFAHTEGSVIAQGQAIVKNGNSLHFVRISVPEEP